MNRGLLLKTLRETWPTTSLFCVGFFAAEGALGFVLPRFQEQFSQQLLQLPFVATFVRALVGGEGTAEIGPEMFAALAWVHPIVLAIVWAQAIVFCTRVPAGEVDRGTIDVLLSLPVSRWRVHGSETVVWVGSTVVMFGAGLVGNRIGGVLGGAVIGIRSAIIAAVNLCALTLAVGAVAWLLSALSDRRGRAVGAAFVFVAASFLVNYLAEFWRPLEAVAPMSLLHYHRPILAIRNGAWPVRDLCVLVGAAGVAWAGAGVVFSRRDLMTT